MLLKSHIIWSETRLTNFLVPDQIAKLLVVMCSLVPRLSLLIASSTITGGLGMRLNLASFPCSPSSQLSLIVDVSCGMETGHETMTSTGMRLNCLVLHFLMMGAPPPGTPPMKRG